MAYSPPTESPCIIRAITSSTGAASPMLAKHGVTAMTSEPAAITVTDRVSADRRPCRSAYRPRIQPPIGRIRNPTAKTAAVESSCAVVSPSGKNAFAKYTLNAA